MRQELVDVSIMLQLIDKNNFHVYSASSSANMPGTARLSAKVLPILQFYSCTQQEKMCSSFTLPFLHIHAQPCADECIPMCPHTFTPMTPALAHVFTYKRPQTACKQASSICLRIHGCACMVTYRNTCSDHPLRNNRVRIKACGGLKMPSLKGIRSPPPKHSHAAEHR